MKYPAAAVTTPAAVPTIAILSMLLSPSFLGNRMLYFCNNPYLK